ncbi:substrate-binding domain-containing protein [Nakamurella sp. UYEF19]|uniref:sugar ABC transporter substrate-binding protein n=1 Tax=Nakamurella sp. UYEF19 TaxID=1756392 RepID=UPI0033977850
MIPKRADRRKFGSVPPIGRSGLSSSTMCSTRHTVLDRGRRATLVLAAVLATILAACSGTSGAQVTGGQITTAPPVPITAPATSTSSVPSQTLSGGTTQAGTMVPFRTVAAGSAVAKRIGLVAPNASDPLGKEVTESIAVQLKSAGAELISCDPGDDQGLVLDCARRLATEHVDGWIIVQPGDLGQALCDVGPKKVPLIAIAASPISCQTVGVGADDRQAGFLVGRELAGVPRNLSDCARSSFVVVTNPAAGTVNAERVAGIKAGFSAVCPGLIGDVRVLDAGTQDRAYDAFTAVLATLPADADVLVAAVNDGAALGVLSAIPETRSASVSVAAVGADQRARCEMLGNAGWLGDAALFPDRYGEVAVPALLDVLAGRSVPGVLHVRTSFVTAQTLPDFYPVESCPSP